MGVGMGKTLEGAGLEREDQELGRRHVNLIAVTVRQRQKC